ncbi:hypothetical protein BT93_G1710 [Corymbia citriodora subsp. variegata]|nr:hypothetical protein BT93_G1710 [Corymbia citriodora subsp. variegata]
MDLFRPNPFCLCYTPNKAFPFLTVLVLLLFPSKIPEMGVESSMSSKVVLRLVISILTIISLEGWVAPASSKNDSCEPLKCGDSVNDHPSRNNTKTCCRGKPLSLEPFWEDLVDHDHQSNPLILEFEKTGNACFAEPKDFHIPPSAFDPLKPSYLAFLRNCSSFPNADYPYPHSTCPSPGANRSYVARMFRLEIPRLNLSACESHVIVPVKLAGPDDGDEIENVDSKGEWKQLFRLEWNLTSWENCVKCRKRGGKCRGGNGRFRCRGNAFRLTPSNSNANLVVT